MGHDPHPLTLTEGGANLADSRLARESLQLPAHGALVGVTDEESHHCGSCACTDPEDAGAQACSSDWPACPAMLGAARGEANDASEGRGNRARFTSCSTVAFELTACFLDMGT